LEEVLHLKFAFVASNLLPLKYCPPTKSEARSHSGLLGSFGGEFPCREEGRKGRLRRLEGVTHPVVVTSVLLFIRNKTEVHKEGNLGRRQIVLELWKYFEDYLVDCRRSQIRRMKRSKIINTHRASVLLVVRDGVDGHSILISVCGHKTLVVLLDTEVSLVFFIVVTTESKFNSLSLSILGVDQENVTIDLEEMLDLDNSSVIA
jgi:hypothetical protein